LVNALDETERGKRCGVEASMPTRLARAPLQQSPVFGQSKEKHHLATIVAGTRGSQGQVLGYNRLTDDTEATMGKWGRMCQEKALTGYALWHCNGKRRPGKKSISSWQSIDEVT